MKWSANKVTIIGLSSVLMGLVGTGIFAYLNLLEYQSRENWVAHTYQVINTSEDLLSALKDVETGQRGYILTGNIEYLQPYQESLPKVRVLLTRLKQLTQDSASQQKTLAQLQPLIDEKLRDLLQKINLRQSQGFDAALKRVNLNTGKRLMDKIRQLKEIVQNREEQLLIQRLKSKQWIETQVNLTVAIALLGSVLYGGCMVLLQFNFLKRQRAEKQAVEIEQHLQDRLQAIVDSAPVIIFLKDLEGKYLLVNRQFEIDTKISRDAAIGQTADAFFPKAVARQWHRKEQKLLQEGTSLEHEEVMKLPTGDITYFSNLYSIRNRQNETYAICGMATNITSLKRAQKQLTQLIQLQQIAFAEIWRSRQTLTNVLDSIIQGFVAMDKDCQCTYVNRRAGELLQCAPESLMGKNAWAQYPDAVGNAFYQALLHALETQQTAQVEQYYEPLNLWLDNWIYPSSEGVAVFFEDITARKQNEEELRIYREELEALVKQRTAELLETNIQLQQELKERERAEAALSQSERKYRTITENSRDLIIRHDRELNFLYVNPVFEKLTGTPAKDWIGKNLMNMGFPSNINQQIADACEVVFKTGEANILEHKASSPHGWRIFQALIAPEFDDRHIVESVLISTRDVTEFKENEALIQEAERRWRSLLDNVQLVVVGLNLQGEVEYINPFFLELTGYKAAEVMGHGWFELFLPKSQQKMVLKAFEEHIEQEFHPHFQNAIVTKAGEERTISWNNTQLRNPQGEVIGTMSIGEDITERFLLERIKAEFISVVSHELRTPLTSIQSALNLLDEQIVPLDSTRGQEILHIAAEGADRLTRIVNDMLDLERLESGKVSLNLQPCQAENLMIQATDLMQILANEAGVFLETTPQPYALVGDGDRLIQVMTNLLSNAIKFSGQGSTVQFEVELETASALRFCVRDRGRGIPQEQLESIFERFHQVDASDSRQKGGTGLGLAICRSIVQQHGGIIWAESIQSQGSCFCFTVPIGPESLLKESHEMDAA
jgi:PAS domain S-box-containing protein